MEENGGEEIAGALDSKPSNRFQVERVGRGTTDGESEDSTKGGDQTTETASQSSQNNQNGVGDGEEATEKLNPHSADESRKRHVSLQSNGDTNTSLDHDHNSSLTHRRFDTHNLKTFGKNTHEAIPRLDFYRETSNTHMPYKRPTLDELHEEKVGVLCISFFTLSNSAC